MFTRSGVRFLRRYAPWPAFSIAVMVGLLLTRRLALGNVATLKAVIQGYCDA
jgi:hypothetical protein